MIGARPRLFNQGKMPLMQRAHGGHQRDSLPGARRAATPQGGDGFAQQRKFTDDLHVDNGSDKGGHCLSQVAMKLRREGRKIANYIGGTAGTMPKGQAHYTFFAHEKHATAKTTTA